MNEHMIKKAQAYLQTFCIDIGNRCVGSEGNQAATAFFADMIESFGFDVEKAVFDCMDWHQDGVELKTDSLCFEAQVSPYTLGCQVHAPLVVVNSIPELEVAAIGNKIVMLRGEIASEQLMPKSFSFYNPDHHKKIIALLESKNPQAIISATTQDPVMVGSGIYPFPLIEDGDFDIPSVYMTAEEGEKLAQYEGKPVSLHIQAERVPAKAANITARIGDLSENRVVVFAHIDSKLGTPGAIDNAGGVVTLLLLAELLSTYTGHPGIELVALNGEDYYSNPGQHQYLAANSNCFENILLGINIDGIGYNHGKTAYSLYDCPPEMADLINRTFARYDQVIPGEAWYMGDHGLFLMQQRPALAFTSEMQAEVMAIVHTPADRPEIVNTSQVADVASALYELLIAISSG